MSHLLPAAGFGFSKVGLGKVGVVESLGNAGAAFLDDLEKTSDSKTVWLSWLWFLFKQDLGKVEVRCVSSLLYEVALNLGGEIQNDFSTSAVKSPDAAPAGIDGKFS